MAAKKRVEAGRSKQSAEERRVLFTEAYLSNGENALQAAISAGFSPKTAGSQGSRLLKNVEVLSMINSRRAQVTEAAGINTERLMVEIARVAFSDPRKVTNQNGTVKRLHELDDDTAAAVSSFEIDDKGAIKYKFWDKNSSIDKAAKIMGLYEKDNAQKNQLDGIPREVAKLIKDRLLAISSC